MTRAQLALAVIVLLLGFPTSGRALDEGVSAVVSDCWTTNLAANPDVHFELYSFQSTDNITFVWRQKLPFICSDYRAAIAVYDCTTGKAPLNGNPIRFTTQIALGQQDPDPGGSAYRMFNYTLAAGTLPPGLYDWLLAVECSDTNGAVGPDGDVEMVHGWSNGQSLGGPVLFGPQPVAMFDANAAGSPPGRQAGESGVTRPWCFEVQQ